MIVKRVTKQGLSVEVSHHCLSAAVGTCAGTEITPMGSSFKYSNSAYLSHIESSMILPALPFAFC